MINFLTLKPEVFGLDISDLSLKIIKLKKKKNFFKITSFLEDIIEQGIIKGGEIRNEEALINTIKKAVGNVMGEELKTKYVVISLPEEKSFLQIIQMPKMPLEDLKSAVIYEAENYIPLPIEQVYLDFQIVKPIVGNVDHFDIMIAALPRKTVDSYLKCVREAGLIPYAFEIESIAIARALIKNGVSPFPILLVDLGATKTRFIIFSGHSLRFNVSIDFSGKKLTQDVADSLGISFQEAERLKIQYGLEPMPKVLLKGEKENSKFKKGIIGDTEVSSILATNLEYLNNEIKKYIDYYLTHSSHEHLVSENRAVEKIIICGGGANLKGLSNFIFSELEIPVELGNPLINLSSNSQKNQSIIYREEELQKYATAIGLCLRSFYNINYD